MLYKWKKNACFLINSLVEKKKKDSENEEQLCWLQPGNGYAK